MDDIVNATISRINYLVNNEQIISSSNDEYEWITGILKKSIFYRVLEYLNSFL